MKDRECVTCAKLIDCKGKASKEPCLNYKKWSEKNANKQQTERRKI